MWAVGFSTGLPALRQGKPEMCLVVKVTSEEVIQGYGPLLRPPGWGNVSTE